MQVSLHFDYKFMLNQRDAILDTISDVVVNHEKNLQNKAKKEKKKKKQVNTDTD